MNAIRDIDGLKRELEEAMLQLKTPKWRDTHDQVMVSWLAEDFLSFLAPEPQPSSKGQVAQELSQIEQDSLRLLASLHQLSATTVFLYNQSREKSDPTIGDFTRSLEWLSARTNSLGGNWRTNAPQRKGQAAKGRPVAVAKLAARHFHFLTGEEPSRTTEGKAVRGEFPRFLQMVFHALSITQSFDDHAKRAAKWWKQDREAEDLAAIRSALHRMEE